jgi:putative iron-only hydrogenase system regulator
MKKLAVISAILEEPSICQNKFNNVVSEYNSIVKGRLGIPFHGGELGVVCLTVVSKPEKIQEMVEKLETIEHISITCIYSKKDIV